MRRQSVLKLSIRSGVAKGQSLVGKDPGSESDSNPQENGWRYQDKNPNMFSTCFIYRTYIMLLYMYALLPIRPAAVPAQLTVCTASGGCLVSNGPCDGGPRPPVRCCHSCHSRLGVSQACYAIWRVTAAARNEQLTGLQHAR